MAENINMVVQLLSKKRGLHQVKKGISEEDLVKDFICKVFDKMFKNNNFKKIYINGLINAIVD